MSDSDLAYAQGLAYAWGRNDEKNDTGGRLAGPDADSVAFAGQWADAVRAGSSRPDLGGAFEAFTEDRPVSEGRRRWG